jgi:hypothetical protein
VPFRRARSERAHNTPGHINTRLLSLHEAHMRRLIYRLGLFRSIRWRLTGWYG